jgi:hypothetical protein
MPLIEVNPALILRNAEEAHKGIRKTEECIPEEIQVGHIYPFLKKDQRIYWFSGEIPLIEKNEEGQLSRPLASIEVLEVTHFVDNGHIFTRGLYKVTEVFEDEAIHFEGLDKVQQGKSWSSKIKNFIG